MSNKKSEYAADRLESERYIRLTEKQLQTERIDPDTYQGKKQLEKLAKAQLDMSSSLLKSVINESIFMKNEASAPFFKKRFQSILQLIPEACSRFSDAFPHLSIEKELTQVNSFVGMLNYNILNVLYYIVLAAALWILDELNRRDRLSEAFKLLPNPTETSKIPLPEYFSDASYDNGLIRSMICLILSRNSEDPDCDCETAFPLDEKALKRAEKTWTYDNAVGDGQEPDTCRQVFDRIIGMLHPVKVERAVKRFEENVWKLFGHYLVTANIIRDKEIAILEDILKMAQDDLKLIDQMEETSKEIHATVESTERMLNRNKGNPLLMHQPSPEDFAANPGLPSKIAMLDSRIDSLADKRNALCDAIEQKEDQLENIRMTSTIFSSMLSFNAFADGDPPDDPNWPDASELESVSISDPFETCFALLYLLDSGAPIAWLVPLSVNVVASACKLLPWYDSNLIDTIQNEDDGADPGETGSPSEIDKDQDGGITEEKIDDNDYTPPDLTEFNEKLYAKKYRDPNKLSEKSRNRKKDRLLNFPQYVYSLTDMTIPRVLYQERTAEDCRRAGFNRKEADLFSLYLSLVDGSFDKGFYMQRAAEYWFSGKEIPQDEPQDEQPDQSAETTEKSGAETAQQLEEIRALKDEKKALLRKTEALEKEKEKLETEIAELRTLIRSGANVQRNRQNDAPEVVFPYKAQKRYVVFGGHDSWLRAIRPLLDNVRFIGPNSRPDAGLILNADVIWFQTNAIGHANFYKIINIIRTHGVPVRYFSFASAEKCAEELALSDMEYGDESSKGN